MRICYLSEQLCRLNGYGTPSSVRLSACLSSCAASRPEAKWRREKFRGTRPWSAQGGESITASTLRNERCR